MPQREAAAAGLALPAAPGPRPARVGVLIALAGATFYGINIVGARIAAQAGISGPDIVVYRALLLLPLAVAIVLGLRQRLTLTSSERGPVLRFALCSTGTALGYMSSLKFLPVPIAVTIFYTYPLLVILLSPYATGVRITPRRWAVAIVAFLGVMLAVGPHLDGLDPRGVALAFIGALFSAGMFITGAALTTPGMVTFTWSQIIALPLALAFAYGSGGLSESHVIAGAALAFGVTALGFFLGLLMQILAGSRLSAASSGLLFLFEPVVAITAAALVLGEHITLPQGLGMAIIIAALIFDVLPNLRPPARLGLDA